MSEEQGSERIVRRSISELNPEEMLEVGKLYTEGLPLKQIRSQLAVTDGVIYQVKHRLRIKSDRSPRSRHRNGKRKAQLEMNGDMPEPVENVLTFRGVVHVILNGSNVSIKQDIAGTTLTIG